MPVSSPCTSVLWRVTEARWPVTSQTDSGWPCSQLLFVRSGNSRALRFRVPSTCASSSRGEENPTTHVQQEGLSRPQRGRRRCHAGQLRRPFATVFRPFHVNQAWPAKPAGGHHGGGKGAGRCLPGGRTVRGPLIISKVTSFPVTLSICAHSRLLLLLFLSDLWHPQRPMIMLGCGTGFQPPTRFSGTFSNKHQGSDAVGAI